MPLKCSRRSTTDGGSLHARWTRRLAARSMWGRAPTPPRPIADDAIHLMQHPLHTLRFESSTRQSGRRPNGCSSEAFSR